MKIRLMIEVLEADKVGLRTEAGQSVVWPRQLLPGPLVIGEIFDFYIENPDKACENQALAKRILNEALRLGDQA